MPIAADQSTPAGNRASRAPRTTIAATIATTGVVTVASGALDGLQNGDIVTLVEAAPGTAWTGGTGGTTPANREQDLYLEKLSATTCQLHVGSPAGAVVAPGVALSAGGALRYGKLDAGQGILAPNIVAAGSARGGAFGTPLD